MLLAAAGLWQLGGGAWIYGKAWLAQILIARAWAEAGIGDAVRPWPWADTRPVARLSVPELGIDQIVLAGASGRSLAFGPGHLDGTALPGTPGLSVVSGHRDTHFRFLEQLRAGTLVRIERSDGVWQDYRVTQSRVVNVEELRIAQTATGQPRLLLTTCYPFDAVAPGGPLRYVVLAEAP
jgi:sortase A